MNQRETAISKKLLGLLMVMCGVALLIAIGALLIAKQPRELSLIAAAGGCCAYYDAQAEPNQSISALQPQGFKADPAQKAVEEALTKIRLGKYDAQLNCKQATSCK